MGQGNKSRPKKPAWDPLKDYDERAKAYQAERKIQAKYNREQGADLPKSLVEQIQNRGKIEQAKGGQYETSVRKGPRQGWHTVTKDIPFEGPYSIMQTEINNLKFAAEHATNDQISRSMFNHARQMENEMIAAQQMDNPTTVEVVNRTETKDQLGGRSGAQARIDAKNKKNETPKVESEFELKGGPLKSEDQAREEWLEKTRNSPAQKSGAWAGREEELWEQSKKSGANKGREFAEAIKKPEVKSEGLLNNMKKR